MYVRTPSILPSQLAWPSHVSLTLGGRSTHPLLHLAIASLVRCDLVGFWTSQASAPFLFFFFVPVPVSTAIRLIFWIFSGKVLPTYESSSVSHFKHGRTETVRSLTSDMKDFVEKFENANVSHQDKLEAFRKGTTPTSALATQTSDRSPPSHTLASLVPALLPAFGSRKTAPVPACLLLDFFFLGLN